MTYHLPDCDVKDIWTYGGWNSHVAKAFPRHNDASNKVRNWSAGRQKGQTHYLKEMTKRDKYF